MEIDPTSRDYLEALLLGVPERIVSQPFVPCFTYPVRSGEDSIIKKKKKKRKIASLTFVAAQMSFLSVPGEHSSLIHFWSAPSSS